MRVLDKRPSVSRRKFLRTGSVTLLGITIMPGGAIVGHNSAWAATATALKPETFATLVQMSRDTYPHDQLSDAFYAKAVAGFDAAAAASEDDKALFETGVAELNSVANAIHGVPYNLVGWEANRVALLRGMEESGFFQRVRSSLITGIYNNQDAWPLFGYEGESASEGGYIERGFDDIDWLDTV